MRLAREPDAAKPDRPPVVIVCGALADHARRQPDRAAIACDDETLSWSELVAARDVLAAAIDRCAPHGRRVTLNLRNGPHYLPLLLAILHTGREAQILDPDWPTAMTTALIADLSPDLLLAHTPLATAQAISIALPQRDDLATWLAALEKAALGTPRQFFATPQTSFYVGFTSGSTGLPKGYRRTHASWVASFEAEAAAFDIGPEDVMLAHGALSHSLFLYAALRSLHIGASVLTTSAFRGPRAMQAGHSAQASIVYGTPTQLLVSAKCKGPRPQPRWILSSGAKLEDHHLAILKNAFPTSRIAEFYGASELSFVAAREAGDDAPVGSVGRAFRDVTISIRDSEGNERPVGQTGLIHVESPMLFTGYATSASPVLRRHGNALCVGDVGCLDAQGYLTLQGRADRMILSAGANIHPEPIEAALATHPAVRAAAVLPQADALRGSKLLAIVDVECSVASRELVSHCRERLPKAYVPHSFLRARDWPMTRTGKTDFAVLAANLARNAFEPLP